MKDGLNETLMLERGKRKARAIWSYSLYPTKWCTPN